MADDHRAAIYEDLYRRQLVPEQAQNRESASRILGILFDYIRPKSVLDVGCVLGTWLRIVQEMDVPDIQGIEGEWLDPAQIQIDPNRVVILDLEHGFDVKRRFDLLLCLEVAEHLSASAADPLVASLTAYTDFVFFRRRFPFRAGMGISTSSFCPTGPNASRITAFSPSTCCGRAFGTIARSTGGCGRTSCSLATSGPSLPTRICGRNSKPPDR